MSADNTAGRIAVKICGITRGEDALWAAACGARYIGFIFAESPRRISAAQARRIGEALPSGVERVGVFVNEEEAVIRRVCREAGLSLIQLHGDESPEFCRRFELPVIKVLRARDESSLAAVAAYDTGFILLEPYLPGKYGGTGIPADWAIAARLVQTYPQKRFFLAGGIGPDNVIAAVRQVAPYAVDASSALEHRPGLKNHEKIERLLKAVREL